MKKILGVFVDLKRCVGCYACVVACKEVNKLLPGFGELPPPKSINWIQIETHVPEGKFPDPGLFYVPKHCNHCERPACVNACPAGAIHKREDGIVVVDPDTCTGCQDCIDACPYGQIFYNEDRGVVEKCTLCVDLIDRGQDPACVSTCVGGALCFGDLNDPESKVAKRINTATITQRFTLAPSKEGDPGPCVRYGEL